MTDSFLDRLDDQLLGAERALVAASPERSRGSRRRSRRLIVAPLLALAAAVPAVALTQPWRPILGGPRDAPVGTSSTPVPSDARALLGVLRRPQSPQDRGVIVQHLLRGVGQEFAGVRLDSVRLVTLAAGRHALVISSESVGRQPTFAMKGPGKRVVAVNGIGDPVCLVWSSGGTCGDAADLRMHGIIVAGRDILGLVPDGVAKVTFSFSGGQTASAGVHDNVFAVATAPTTSRAIPGSAASHGHAIAPLVMVAPFTVSWLDVDGRVIAPPRAG